MTARHNAASVALAVMKRIERPVERGSSAQVNAMQVQKLVYYSQAYSLALYDRPLFREDVQAWVHGPVVRELWELHRGKISISAQELEASAKRRGHELTSLNEEEALVVDAVCETLGGLTGWQLRNRTHEEAPWIAHFDRSEQFHDQVIPWDDMREYYKDR